jgi:hypothetical protein
LLLNDLAVQRAATARDIARNDAMIGAQHLFTPMSALPAVDTVFRVLRSARRSPMRRDEVDPCA